MANKEEAIAKEELKALLKEALKEALQESPLVKLGSIAMLLLGLGVFLLGLAVLLYVL